MATLETIAVLVEKVVKTGAERRKALDEVMKVSREVATTEQELPRLSEAKEKVSNAVENLMVAMKENQGARDEFWNEAWRWESRIESAHRSEAMKSTRGAGMHSRIIGMHHNLIGCGVPSADSRLSLPSIHPSSSVEGIHGPPQHQEHQERASSLQSSTSAPQHACLPTNHHRDCSSTMPKVTTCDPMPVKYGNPISIRPPNLVLRHLPYRLRTNAMQMNGDRGSSVSSASPRLSGFSTERRAIVKARLRNRRIESGRVSKLPVQSDQEKLPILNFHELDGSAVVLANASLEKLEAERELMMVTKGLEDGVAAQKLAAQAKAKENLNKACEEMAIAEWRFRSSVEKAEHVSQVFEMWHSHRQKMDSQGRSSQEEGSQKKRKRKFPDARSVLGYYVECWFSTLRYSDPGC